MTIGNYTIERLLGEGGMASVYAARAPDGSRVALKILKLFEKDAPELRKRFLREAKIQQQLGHCPHICKCYETFVDDGRDVLVLEYLDGVSLDKQLESQSPTPKKLVTWAQHVLTALSAAHALGVIHRDVKPANIIITRDGKAVLTDFGIAHTRNSRMTQTGTRIGSVPYMSPEQLAGKICKATDVYALGVTLYEAATGSFPFGELSNEYEISRAIVDRTPFPSIQTRAPHLPPAFAQFVDRAIAKNEHDRFPTAAHALQALQQCDGFDPGVQVPRPGGGFVSLQDILRGIGKLFKDVFKPGSGPTEKSVHAHLIVYAAGKFHSEYEIRGNEFVIGRDSSQCHLVINNELVSRRHAILTRTGSGAWRLQDLSTNGTYVNGRSIGRNNTVLLAPGTRFSCCKTLKYEFAVE